MASIGNKDCFAVARERSDKMTAYTLGLLVEVYHMGTDFLLGQTAERRGAVNLLARAGLVTFRDPQVPQNGLQITERGRRHVERLLSLPIAKEPQQGPQNAPGDVAPRFVWAYAEDGPSAPAERPLTAGEALNMMVAGQGALSNPLASSIFLEALTWDQQARVLERLGWRRVG